MMRLWSLRRNNTETGGCNGMSVCSCNGDDLMAEHTRRRLDDSIADAGSTPAVSTIFMLVLLMFLLFFRVFYVRSMLGAGQESYKMKSCGFSCIPIIIKESTEDSAPCREYILSTTNMPKHS